MISIEQPLLTEEERAKQTVNAPIAEAEEGFNWRHCWYPVTFLQDLPLDRPFSFSLYDEPYVLFKNKDGQFGCVTDRCPHRAAKLSDGQIIDGKLECSYHGWQFGVDGQCLHIPQLPADAKIPTKACVQSFKIVERQGIIWMWPGQPEAADEKSIPTLAALDKPEFVTTDYVGDMPYDQTYLIENVIDISHIYIAHNGVRGGGKREDAQALEMEIIERSVQGVRGRYRPTRKPNQFWRNLDFIAPNLVLYTLSYPDPSLSSGLALYTLPLGKSRCRVLYRRFTNFETWKERLRPRWLEHLNQNKIFEQDLPIIMGQKKQIEQSGKNLKELYLPLKTSDMLAVEYRKWLDKFGQSLPFYQGYSTCKPTSNNSNSNQDLLPIERLARHTLLCNSCNRAYQVTKKLKQSLVVVAIAIAALGIVTDRVSSKILVVSLFLASAALAVIFDKFKSKFELSHTHH